MIMKLLFSADCSLEFRSDPEEKIGINSSRNLIQFDKTISIGRPSKQLTDSHLLLAVDI